MQRKIRRHSINKIIEENLDYLVRFAYYRLGDRAEAEDTVYEGVLKFLEKHPRDIRPEGVRLYLFKIIHNLCRDKIKSKDREVVPIETIEIADIDPDISELYEAERANACLGRLTSRDADIIRMYVIDGLSFVEISEILDMPQSTAKSRFKSGMEKLRKLFTHDKMP